MRIIVRTPRTVFFVVVLGGIATQVQNPSTAMRDKPNHCCFFLTPVLLDAVAIRTYPKAETISRSELLPTCYAIPTYYIAARGRCIWKTTSANGALLYTAEKSVAGMASRRGSQPASCGTSCMLSCALTPLSVGAAAGDGGKEANDVFLLLLHMHGEGLVCSFLVTTACARSSMA
ncbi:hypothetical protein F5Y03DRAFT_340069 [Xylaria venustula]|nr:hypothetical protein F5Y03DRAFT_340069 [Xylaria venustula]